MFHQLKLARDTVSHYKHQTPIAQHRVRSALRDVKTAEHEAEVCELGLMHAKRYESEVMLRLLTCGISHGKALHMVRRVYGG